jgi:predicted RNA-binding Zn-ribbon protein involved in translation (DUF1610 family)
MSTNSNNKLDLKENHVGGNFEWEVEPICSCGRLIKAVEEEKFMFVNNLVQDGYNKFYIMPLSADGSLARSDGVAIENCPWCGDRILGRKKYPEEQ